MKSVRELTCSGLSTHSEPSNSIGRNFKSQIRSRVVPLILENREFKSGFSRMSAFAEEKQDRLIPAYNLRFLPWLDIEVR